MKRIDVAPAEEPAESLPIPVDAKEFGLAANEAQQVARVFKPMIADLEAKEALFNEIVALTPDGEAPTEETCQKARRLRLDLVKVRTGTDDVHKKAKAYYLAGSRFVDAIRNTVKFAVQGKEEKLREIEEYYERREAERIERLAKERAEALAPYGQDKAAAASLDLGRMPEDVWQNYLTGAKANYEAKLEAERIAEEERKAAEAAERERQRLRDEENRRLRAEAEELRRKQQDAEARAAAEREALEAKARAEREERERVERELRDKQEAERKAAAEAEAARIAAEQAELAKGDEERFADLHNELSQIHTRYSFESDRYGIAFREAMIHVDKAVKALEAALEPVEEAA